ncbi:MAG: hypothetical protein QCI82_05315 [Candidatus Thermoplasmatota archaeon]|nr:hypothetical protein [Candidatus Thermoplasmatota archaeon]
MSPGGTTALLDAVGRTINDVEARMAKAEDRPDKVMICILTDGMENASREFSKDRIKEMIEGKRKDQGWEFAFLAANQDAFQEGGNMGIALNMIAKFDATKEGTKGAFHHMNVLTTDYRTKDRSR